MTVITTHTNAFSGNLTTGQVRARLTPMRATSSVHAVTDNLESALTGVVFLAVLLFAAGLVRCAVPACAWRTDGTSALYAIAALAGIFTVACTAKAIFHLAATIRG